MRNRSGDAKIPGVCVPGSLSRSSPSCQTAWWMRVSHGFWSGACGRRRQNNGLRNATEARNDSADAGRGMSRLYRDAAAHRRRVREVPSRRRPRLPARPRVDERRNGGESLKCAASAARARLSVIQDCAVRASVAFRLTARPRTPCRTALCFFTRGPHVLARSYRSWSVRTRSRSRARNAGKKSGASNRACSMSFSRSFRPPRSRNTRNAPPG
jgi:hypothetical protein